MSARNRRAYITPGPRTLARRQHAAAMRRAYESLTEVDRAAVDQLPREARGKVLRRLLERDAEVFLDSRCWAAGAPHARGTRDCCPLTPTVTYDNIVAAYEKMPPPPKPIKLTQAQWDVVRAKTPEYRGVSPFAGILLGTPVEIVDDPADSSVPELRL